MKYEILLHDSNRFPVHCNRPRYSPAHGLELRISPNMCKRDTIIRYLALPLFQSTSEFTVKRRPDPDDVPQNLQSPQLAIDFYALVPDPASHLFTSSEFVDRYLADLEPLLRVISEQVEIEAGVNEGDDRLRCVMGAEKDMLTCKPHVTDAKANDAEVVGVSIEQAVFQQLACLLKQCYRHVWNRSDVDVRFTAKRHLNSPIECGSYHTSPDYTVFVDMLPMMVVQVFDSDSHISCGMKLYFGDPDPMIDEHLNKVSDPEEVVGQLKHRFKMAFDRGLKDVIVAGVDRMVLFDSKYFMFFQFDLEASIKDTIPLKGYHMVRHDANIYTARAFMLGFSWDPAHLQSTQYEASRFLLFRQLRKPDKEVFRIKTSRKQRQVSPSDQSTKLTRIASNMSSFSLNYRGMFLYLEGSHRKYRVDVVEYVIEQLEELVYRIDWNRLMGDVLKSGATPGPLTALVQMFESSSDQRQVITMYRKCRQYQGKYVSKMYGYGELQLDSQPTSFVVVQDLAKPINVVDFRNARHAQSAFTALSTLLEECNMKHVLFDDRNLALSKGQVVFARFLSHKQQHRRIGYHVAENWQAFSQLWPMRLLTDQQKKFLSTRVDSRQRGLSSSASTITTGSRVTLKSRIKHWMHIN